MSICTRRADAVSRLAVSTSHPAAFKAATSACQRLDNSPRLDVRSCSVVSSLDKVVGSSRALCATHKASAQAFNCDSDDAFSFKTMSMLLSLTQTRYDSFPNTRSSFAKVSEELLYVLAILELVLIKSNIECNDTPILAQPTARAPFHLKIPSRSNTLSCRETSRGAKILPSANMAEKAMFARCRFSVCILTALTAA